MHTWSNMMLNDNREIRKEQNEQKRDRGRNHERNHGLFVAQKNSVKSLQYPTSTIQVR